MTPMLLAAVPHTPEWSPTVAVIMILCNILAAAIAKSTIKNPNVGPAMPSPELFGGLSQGAVIGTACFGHILGAGVILGLSYSGAI
ncbi:photosystem I reaction center subunit PsaK [Trichothermofontia sichuanensis B231]|uniref:photosystem I reaction center subunit PsaK n=1 Tax=Trichothermofontia sichuanensis TaxID=3045816 RepID=UPI002245DC4B|nr:photosystem I reaction center subunit PsaK [Trichothermofontia sichuanensis B231]